MSKNSYDHLDPIKVDLDLDGLASTLVNSNYGVHRFLSALIKQRERHRERRGWGEDELMQEIEKLLNRGLH